MRVLTPHLSCIVNMPLSPDDINEFDRAVAEGYAEIYAITGEGIIKHHKLRGQNRYIRVKVDKVPGFEIPRLQQAISFLPNGKIPKTLFDQILAFFYKVMEVNGDKALEAMAWICYNADLGYHILIPPQTVGGASVTYDWSCVPPGTSIIVDIHSHNNMGAFFSGTDNRDDGGNISFSGVCGQLLAEKGPQTVWRFNYQERKFEAKFEDIFEAQLGEVPAEWISQVKISAPARSTWTHPQNGRGRADHLKDFQFQKGSNQQGSSGSGKGKSVRAGEGQGEVREGPYIRGRLPLDFGGDFWGLGDDIYGSQLAESSYDYGRGGISGDEALARALEDPEGDSQGVLPLGKTWAGLANNVAAQRAANLNVEAGPASLADDGVPGEDMTLNGHERFDELAVNHGVAVAESYCIIDDFMSSLSGKDTLLEELIADMFELSSEEGQADIFKSLYNHLPRHLREKIATSGF